MPRIRIQAFNNYVVSTWVIRNINISSIARDSKNLLRPLKKKTKMKNQYLELVFIKMKNSLNIKSWKTVSITSNMNINF